MNKLVSIILILLGAMQLIDAQTNEEKNLIIKQIQQKDRKLETFITKGMTDSTANMFSPNCHFAPEYAGIIEGRDEVRAFYAREKKGGKKFVGYSLKAIEHKVYDDVVLEVGTNSIKYSVGANPKVYTAQYNYMLVWKQSKSGKFQIRAAIWNQPKNPCSQ